MKKILLLFAIFVSLSSLLFGQNYVLEFQSPNGTSFPRHGFMPYSQWFQHSQDYFCSLENVDMDDDGIPEIFISDDQTGEILIYDGVTHEIEWSFESWLEEYSCNTRLFGFYHMDDDNIKEAVMAYPTDGNLGVIEVIDWTTDNVEFTLSNVYFEDPLVGDLPKAFAIDIDNDNMCEIIAEIGDYPNAHIEIWGYETTGVDNPGIQPSQLKLNQNFPNPFNPTTTIDYQLKKSGYIELKIYNTKGQLVDTLVNENQHQGNHSIIWNAKGISSGMYFYQISVDGQLTKSKKAIYLK